MIDKIRNLFYRVTASIMILGRPVTMKKTDLARQNATWSHSTLNLVSQILFSKDNMKTF